MADTTQVKEPIDGFVSTLGGMHAGLDPEVLQDATYSRGINVSSRGGLLRTRPGFVHAKALPAGRFQGMASWALHSGHRVVAVVAGKAQVYNAETDVLTSLDTALDPEAACYFCQAERFFVIQDGINKAVVLQELSDGSVEIRSAAHTIPTGTAMTFAHGRLHVTPLVVPGSSENGKPYLVSGNVFLASNPASILGFTETEYLNEGGAHGLPAEMGYVQAFAALRNAATGTGYGGTVVFAERGASAFDFSVPRDQWKTEALAQVLYFGPGTRSPWSVVPVNGTLIYRATDGLRILSYAVSAAQAAGDTLSLVPQSTEVAPFMGSEDKDYLPYVSAALADNRVFVTAGGSNSRWFKALVVLDAARASKLGSAAAETAYDGIWQIEGRLIGGVTAALRGNEETLFVYADDGYLWRLDPSATLDNGAAIRGRIVTKALMMTADFKKLMRAQYWLRDLRSDVVLSAYYRPLGYPLWAFLASQTFRVPAGSLAQTRRAVTMNVNHRTPTADPVSGEALYLGQGFQFCLDFLGSVTFTMFRCVGAFASEPATSPCDEAASVSVTAGGAGLEIGEYL